MKTAKTTLIAIAAIVIIACNTTKKTPAPAASAPANNNNNNSFLSPNRAGDWIHEPDSADLNAIRIQYSDVDMARLKEGFIIYAQGACIKCHNVKNIYKRGVEQWKGIIDDMAKRSLLSASEKDAVSKYVMAVKAAQPQ